MRILPITVFVLSMSTALAGCSRARAGESTPQNDPPSSTAPGKKAEVTPALEKKAQELLAEHEDAPYGAEYEFSLEGRRYVARIEEHDNTSNEPGRPPGKHKGITVYVAE